MRSIGVMKLGPYAEQHLSARHFVGRALKLADRDAMPLRVGAVAQHLLQGTGRLLDKLCMAFEQRKEHPLLRHDSLKPLQHLRTLEFHHIADCRAFETFNRHCPR